MAKAWEPPADECPLCPSTDGHLTEIPARDEEVVVFENQFTALTPREVGPVFEIRSYTMAPGQIPGMIDRWAAKIDPRERTPGVSSRA